MKPAKEDFSATPSPAPAQICFPVRQKPCHRRMPTIFSCLAALASLPWMPALTGCAHSEEPSFFEQMLSGTPTEEGSRPIHPELRLSCAQANAEVRLDGVLQGHCQDFESKGLPLSRGAHELEISLAGHLPYVSTVEAGAARMSLSIELVRIR